MWLLSYIITKDTQHCSFDHKQMGYFHSMHTVLIFFFIYSLTNRRVVFYRQPLRMVTPSKEEDCPHRNVSVSLDSHN